jgi:deoxyribonuclease-1-like protein
MRLLFIFLFNSIYIVAIAQPITICSWNLKDFGKSKDEKEIEFIASTVRSFDLVAVQEVVAGDGGGQAVARLADELNRKGSKWDYVVSDPTFSSAYKTERYAFLWKTTKLKKLGEAWLEKTYAQQIDREPFMGTFIAAGKQFTVVNFHAITKSKQPETEVKYFKFYPSLYPQLNLIFCGDFNLPQSHSVFNPLRSLKYQSALIGQKTSLKKSVQSGEYLASEFDNFFYASEKIAKVNSGIVAFYIAFKSLTEASYISDHVPIFFTFSIN